MKSILNPSFRYTSSVNTDLQKTFARIRLCLFIALATAVLPYLGQLSPEQRCFNLLITEVEQDFGQALQCLQFALRDIFAFRSSKIQE